MGKMTAVAAAAMVLMIGVLSVGCSDQSGESDQKDSVQRISPDAVVVPAAAAAEVTESQTMSRGLTAFDQAATAKKYLFAFLYKDEDDQTAALREVFQGAVHKFRDRAISIEINASESAEKPFVDRFRASRAPMPLALAIAPNGAVTKGFATTFTEDQLMEGFTSPGMEACLGALQRGKIVLVCCQNAATRHNREAMAGVREFSALPQYASLAEVVMVDPADPAEDRLCKTLGVTAQTEEAMTVLLSPPGSAVAKFEGPTDKASIEKTLLAAVSRSCSLGSSCCPK